MKGRALVARMMILLVALLAGNAQAFTIFFWDHDNGVVVLDPVYNTSLNSTQSLTRALDEMELEYTINANLPSADQLCEYDLMMTSLSYYCPG